MIDEFSCNDPFLVDEIYVLMEKLSRSITEEVLRNAGLDVERDLPPPPDRKNKTSTSPPHIRQ